MLKLKYEKLNRLVLIIIAIAVFGNDIGCATDHAYPTWAIPEKPHIEITDTGANCMSAEGLKDLNSYVIELEQQVQQYRCEIDTINGDSCP